MSKTFHTGVKIAAGQSVSGIVPTPDLTVVGLVVPAGWTAADITFLASIADAGTNAGTLVSAAETAFYDLTDAAGNEVTINADASKYFPLAYEFFSGVKNLKIRSGTSAAPVNQGAERTLFLVLRNL